MFIRGKEIKVAAIDFDGTLFTEEKYPEVGEPIQDMIEFVKMMKSRGVQLILNTNREGEPLEKAVAACVKVGIEFDAINENLPWRVAMWGPSRKIGADLYIDDKAINPIDCPVNLLSLVD